MGWGTGLVASDAGEAPVVIDVSAGLTALADTHPVEVDLLRRVLGDSLQGWRELIVNWDSVRPALSALREAWAADPHRLRAATSSYSDLGALPPLVAPTARLFAAGANFADHAARALTKATGKLVTEESLLEEKRRG